MLLFFYPPGGRENVHWEQMSQEKESFAPTETVFWYNLHDWY